jgi:hypothetical protein
MIFKYRQSTDVPDRAFDNNNIRYQVKQELVRGNVCVFSIPINNGCDSLVGISMIIFVQY